MEWLVLVIIAVIIYSFMNRKKDTAELIEDSDADLADFRITISTSSSYSREPESKNKEQGKWIQPGKTVKIGTYEVEGGFFYSGGRLTGLDSYTEESSLIDPTLKINSKSPDYNGDNMGYWPSYCHISPESRAAYIEWLVSDRSNPDCYIGYVFLYFYGIERRLLVDGKGISATERKDLVNELLRLKNIYGANRSFNGYVTSLLAHTWALYNSEDLPDISLLTAKRGFTSVFKFLLGQSVAAGKPVSCDLALAWVKSHPDFSLRTPARRCEVEFDQLFTLRYQEKYGDGVVVKPNKTKLQLEYHPASSSLHGYQSLHLDLPDASRLIAPVRKLMSLAELCTEELESFSRFLGKTGNSRESLSAVALLPRDLATSIQHDRFNQLKCWLSSKITQPVGVVPTEDLLSQLGEDSPVKINKKEAEMLANLVEKAGYGLAPDVRFHQAKPEINGNIVLFQNGHGSGFNPSHTFSQVGTILRLGSMVAAIDGHIDDAEVSILEKLISDDFQLSEVEKKSLRAYLHWRLNTKENMNGLKTRLDSISSREKSAVSHILVGVALADGKIDPTEIKQLEKLYSSLGLDKALVSSDIHTFSSNKSRTLPPENKPFVNLDAVSGPTFSLNRDLLKVYKEETEGVKAVLESIFVDEKIVDEPEDTVEEIYTATKAAGLDANHATFYDRLIVKEQWSIEEVNAICKELNLMVDGAIEVINDWAFDHVDAPLIDEGSTIYVDLEVAQEMKAH